MKCYSCGIDKDPNSHEVYPYPDELCDGPPLHVLECQSKTGWDFRAVVVCSECFHKLEPDMWIGEKCWESLNPKVLFENLPKVSDMLKWNPLSYPEID